MLATCAAQLRVRFRVFPRLVRRRVRVLYVVESSLDLVEQIRITKILQINGKDTGTTKRART